MFTLSQLTLTAGHVPPPILKIEPGDVIVVSSPHRMNQEFMTTLRDKTKELFPGHRVVVFGDGIQFSTVRPAHEPSAIPTPDTIPIPPSGFSKCCNCGHQWPTGTNGSHSCIDTLKQRASKGFATCQSGSGRPKIVIEFQDLHDCQQCYETLVLLWGGEYQPPSSLKTEH